MTETEPRTQWQIAKVVIAAIAVRAAAAAFLAPGVMQPIEEGYFDTAATLASGKGLLMRVYRPPEVGATPAPFVSVLDWMRVCQQNGARVDPDHPFPDDSTGWEPATLHAPGYSLLIAGVYKFTNYRALTFTLRALQIVLDALACIFIYWFASRLFDRRVGMTAAWIFALLPSSIINVTALLPDTLHAFFTSLALCLSLFAKPNRGWMLIVAGLALGVACYFRSEYLLLPFPLCLALWLSGAQIRWVAGWGMGMVAVMLTILSPWVIWTNAHVGRPILTNSGTGGSMYEGLGEDPNNPWGIRADDSWMSRDAQIKGFPGPWSAEANAFYGRRVREYVGTYPLRYAKIVLLRRLPLALVPPYFLIGSRTTYQEFNFSKYRLEEGLSHFQVIQKYPGKVLRYMWREIIIAGLSALLLLALLGYCILDRQSWRRNVWLFVPWAHIVAAICLVKQVEPRNVAPALVVQSVAAAAALIKFLDGVCKKRPLANHQLNVRFRTSQIIVGDITSRPAR